MPAAHDGPEFFAPYERFLNGTTWPGSDNTEDPVLVAAMDRTYAFNALKKLERWADNGKASTAIAGKGVAQFVRDSKLYRALATRVLGMPVDDFFNLPDRSVDPVDVTVHLLERVGTNPEFDHFSSKDLALVAIRAGECLTENYIVLKKT